MHAAALCDKCRADRHGALNQVPSDLFNTLRDGVSLSCLRDGLSLSCTLGDLEAGESERTAVG